MTQDINPQVTLTLSLSEVLVTAAALAHAVDDVKCGISSATPARIESMILAQGNIEKQLGQQVTKEQVHENSKLRIYG